MRLSICRSSRPGLTLPIGLELLSHRRTSLQTGVLVLQEASKGAGSGTGKSADDASEDEPLQVSC